MKKLLFLLLVLAPAGFAQGPAYPYSVSLSWTASSTTGITGQNVYRAPYTSGACGTYTKLTTTQLAGTIASYSDTSVAPAAIYCYGVTALVGTAESGMAVVSNIPIPPAPPTNLNSTVN